MTNRDKKLLKEAGMTDKLHRSLAKVPSFDKKHVAGLWEVTGPVMSGTIDMTTGKESPMKNVGYGINAVAPAIFGGTVIVNHGLTKEWARRIVDIHNNGVKP